MKKSLFNSIVKISEENVLLYNAYSGSFLVASKNNHIIDDINDLHKRTPSLYNALVKNHFIVKDDEDEIDQVKKMQQRTDHDRSFYYLIINPTLSCNFKCWYCYESKPVHSKIDSMTEDRINMFISNQINENPKLKFFNLSFFGGEPFLNYKYIKRTIERTFSECKRSKIQLGISFTTNGYLLNRCIVEELAKYKDVSFQITLDGNRELHNRVRFVTPGRGSYDKIIENVKLLLRNNMRVTLRVNYTSENIVSTNNILQDFEDVSLKDRKGLNVQFHRVWQDSQGKNIDEMVDNTTQHFQNKGFTAFRYPLNNVRCSCYADKLNEALINFNGDVFHCSAVDFLKHKRDGYLDDNGKIVWENDSFEHRKNIKFRNKPCLSCRILPICNGGCSQKALEYEGKDYCILGYDEKEKDRAILNNFELEFPHMTKVRLK